MGKPKAPTPPDPVATASAQTATNIGTAVANTASGQVNQIGPYGSLTYDRTGEYTYTDPLNGREHIIPTYTATTELTPEAQEVYDRNLSAQRGLAETADRAANFLPDYMGNIDPIDTSEIEGRLFDLGRARLDPMFDERGEALRTSLVNRGIGEGSEVWNREMGRFDESRNDAYNNLLLTGRGQARMEAEADHVRPINKITALLSGSQVATPNYNIATPAQAATTDYAGIVNQNYQQEMQNFNAESASYNNLMGGLFGLGAAGIRMF